MDDEVIPRRDAVAGLGLMATLLVALVGTIAFRIANSSRDQAGPPRRSMASAETAADAINGDAAASAPLGSKVAVAEIVDAVQQATHEQHEPAPRTYEHPAESFESPRFAPPPVPEAPRFLAPSER